MADVKISALPAAASALGADELPVNEAGTTKKVTITQISTLLATLIGLKTKAGLLANTDFSGSPRKATVTFSAAFASVNYTILVLGIDSRSWTYESKTTAGFVINSNAATALTGEVSWQAIASGES